MGTTGRGVETGGAAGGDGGATWTCALAAPVVTTRSTATNPGILITQVR
jgi:hypothetical protein